MSLNNLYCSIIDLPPSPPEWHLMSSAVEFKFLLGLILEGYISELELEVVQKLRFTSGCCGGVLLRIDNICAARFAVSAP